MSYDQKQEVFDVEKVEQQIDAERTSVVLQEQENSPIPEVAAMVSIEDDPSLPVLTFRFWVMAVLFSVLLAFINQFLYVFLGMANFVECSPPPPPNPFFYILTCFYFSQQLVPNCPIDPHFTRHSVDFVPHGKAHGPYPPRGSIEPWPFQH